MVKVKNAVIEWEQNCTTRSHSGAVKSLGTTLARPVALGVEMRSVYDILSALDRPRRRWQENTKLFFTEMRCECTLDSCGPGKLV
jgi:hypothetical protein